jgi:ferredoxin
MSQRLRVDPTACAGHGLCAELLPEHITLDEWGYPLIDDRPVAAAARRPARQAVTACPALALSLTSEPGRDPAHGPRRGDGRSEETQRQRIMHL